MVARVRGAGGDDETAGAAIESTASRIAKKFRPRRIVLFGSQARGTANYHSDIGLLVVMDDGTDRENAAIEMTRAVMDSPIAKDIIVTAPDEIVRRGDLVGTVLRPALREGVTLYERE